MKNSVKILIIIATILGAIWGVLYFSKTQIEPPVKIEQINCHLEKLKEEVAIFEKQPANVSISTAEREFCTLRNKIQVLNREELVPTDELSTYEEKCVRVYVPIFIADCNSKFSQQNWDRTNRQYISQRYNYLRNQKNINNRDLVSTTTFTNFTLIKTKLDNFSVAATFLNNLRFSSLQQSQNDIRKAQMYLNESYIANSSIAGSLRNVKQRLNLLHYYYVCNELEKYTNFSQFDNYNAFQSSFNSNFGRILADYDNNAIPTYGSRLNINNINNRMSEIDCCAHQYYNNIICNRNC